MLLNKKKTKWGIGSNKKIKIWEEEYFELQVIYTQIFPSE